jgi:hypothetical protein
VFCRALAKVVAKVWLLQAYFATKKARLFNAAVRPAKLKSYAGAGRTAYLVILFRCYPNPHKRYELEGYLVARELGASETRVDMAVLKEGQPICLIQLKAAYSFNAANYKYNYVDRNKKRLNGKEAFEALVADDEYKMRQHAAEHTAMYWLLLITHPDGCFEPSYERVVKYRREINAALNTTYRTAAQVRAKAEENMRDVYNSRNVIHAGRVIGGTVFGRGIEVLFWLVKTS